MIGKRIDLPVCRTDHSRQDETALSGTTTSTLSRRQQEANT